MNTPSGPDDPRDDEPQVPPPAATPPGAPPGTPPPPAGGYGPPPGGYGPPPGGWPAQDPHRSTYQISDAISFGWRKFVDHLGPIAIGMLAIIGVTALVYAVGLSILVGAVAAADWQDVLDLGQFTQTPGEWAALGGLAVGYSIVSLVSALLSLVVSAGIIRAALDMTRGGTVLVSRIFSLDNVLHVILAAIVLPILIGIGLVLFVLPGIVIWFYTIFTLHFIVDKRQNVIEAIASSFRFTHANLGPLIGFFVVGVILNFAGALACGVGLLVTIPMTILASAYTYRVLQGETVVP